jgi:hypothetical protein
MAQSFVFLRSNVRSPGERTYYRIEPKRKQEKYCDDDEFNKIYILKEYRKQFQRLFIILQSICKLNMPLSNISNHEVKQISVIKNFHNSMNISYNNIHTNKKSLLELQDVDENDAILIFFGETNYTVGYSNFIKILHGLQNLDISFRIVNLTDDKIPFEIELYYDKQCLTNIITLNDTLPKTMVITHDNLLEEAVSYYKNNGIEITDIVEVIKMMLNSSNYILSNAFKENKIDLKDIQFKFKQLASPESISRDDVLFEVFNIDNTISLI